MTLHWHEVDPLEAGSFTGQLVANIWKRKGLKSMLWQSFELSSLCESKSLKHPVICNESGQALVSHYSISILEVFIFRCSFCDLSHGSMGLLCLVLAKSQHVISRNQPKDQPLMHKGCILTSFADGLDTINRFLWRLARTVSEANATLMEH